MFVLTHLGSEKMQQLAVMKVARDLQLMTALSPDPAGLLRGLVHNVLSDYGAVAAFLGILLDDSRFLILESYGYNNSHVVKGALHSVWNNTAINDSLRTGHIQVFHSKAEYLKSYPHNDELDLPGDGFVAIPVWQKGVPFCAIGISLEADNEEVSLRDRDSIWEITRLFFEIQNDRPVWLENMEQNWPDVKQQLLDGSTPVKPISLVNPSASKLTARQIEVIEGIAQDLTNRQIAYRLHVSESTIGKETVQIYKVLNASNRKEAVAIAISRGLIVDEFALARTGWATV
jgi:DNA-binding CsgD family transcriptional regulator